jgi:hypothetical protein
MTLLYDSDLSYDNPEFYDGGNFTGYLFTPPLVKDRPPFLPDSTPLQKSLWMHYEARLRGVNVWLMSDNSVVQDTATPENSNTDMSNVYPWNPDSPAAPYVRSIFIDPLPAKQVATEHDVSHAVYPVAFFSGGSTHPVTTAQATILADYTAFGVGYSDCLT